jgi:hypothetical protein
VIVAVCVAAQLDDARLTGMVDLSEDILSGKIR